MQAALKPLRLVKTEPAGDLETLFQNPTIREIGDPVALAKTVGDGVSRSSVSAVNTEGRFEIAMDRRGLLWPLKATDYRTEHFVTCFGWQHC